MEAAWVDPPPEWVDWAAAWADPPPEWVDWPAAWVDPPAAWADSPSGSRGCGGLSRVLAIGSATNMSPTSL